MHIFASESGRVALLAGTEGVPVAISIGNFPDVHTVKAIVTNIGVSSTTRHQFLHTLRNFIYVYVFGDTIADLAIGGIGFAGMCNDSDGSSGLDRIVNFYENNRLSTTGQPVKISLGVFTTIKGFLVGFNYQLSDTNSLLGQFALQFKWPPRKPQQVPNPVNINIPVAEVG